MTANTNHLSAEARLAVAEEKLRNLDGVPDALTRIEKKLDRQYAFAAGITFTVSAAWGLIVLVWDRITKGMHS